MTRAERKAKAAEELRQLKTEWATAMQMDYKKTKDFTETVKNLEATVARTINQRPDKKSQYLQALRELVDIMRDSLRKAKEEAECQKSS